MLIALLLIIPATLADDTIETEPAAVVAQPVEDSNPNPQVDCEQITVTLTDLESADERAALDLMDNQGRGLIAIEQELIASLKCVDFRLTAEAVSSVHGATAMARFIERDSEGVVAALRAAGLASAGYELPDNITPGHPLRRHLAGAAAHRGAHDDLSVDEGQTLVVDGINNRWRDITSPAIFQVEVENVVVMTTYRPPTIPFNNQDSQEESL